MPASGSPAGTARAREASRGEAIARAAETPHIILNAPLVGQRLGYPELSGLDLLELFAFVHPGAVRGADRAGHVPGDRARAAGNEADAAGALRRSPGLARHAGDPDWKEREGAWTSNQSLARMGWGWAPLIGARLARPDRGERMLFSRLKQWEESCRPASSTNDRRRSRRSA